MDAFNVALNHAGDSWLSFESTMELQLVSLEFCVACRTVAVVHVKLEEGTPRSLWAHGESPLAMREFLCWEQRICPRVPAVQAYSVTWGLSSGLVPQSSTPKIVSSSSHFSVGDISRTFIRRSLVTHVNPVSAAAALLVVHTSGRAGENMPEIGSKLGSLLLGPIAGTLLLDLVKSVLPSREFTTTAPNVGWSRVRRLKFGDAFNGAMDNMLWPTSLLQLTFGKQFNQSIIGVKWPASLRSVKFGWGFNQPIFGVEWPASLQYLVFEGSFNQSIDGVVWPASLRSLTFGFRFNQPIEEVEWSASLQTLTFGGQFDHPIVGVAWPASLQTLTFGNIFNPSIEGVAWPPSLRTLTFGNSFNQPINGVAWPSSLETLNMGLVTLTLRGS